MVAGYIIDGCVDLYGTLRGGRSKRSEFVNGPREGPHNFVLCHRLSSRVKWAFWWSNAPYFALCVFVAQQTWPRSANPWHECLR